MKSLIHFLHISALAVFLVGCNSETDSVKEAKKENEEKIDSQMTTRSPADSVAMKVSEADANFMVNAASGGMLEVQLGELAQTHARNQRVKDFGAMMIKEHGKGGEKLKALAAAKNITLPDSISNRQQKEKERLQKKKGDAFDEAYIDMMIEDHKKDIREFDNEATNGTNQDIKSFASDNLKMLHVHLDSATSIKKAVTKKIGTAQAPPTPVY
jgi:putative membrane protein